MFAKFLLLLGLIPVFAAFVVRKVMSDRTVAKNRAGLVSLNGKEMAEALLQKGGAKGLAISVRKSPFLQLTHDKLTLSPKISGSHEARDVAEAALLAGLVLMARQQEKVVAWRIWALKFSTAFPAFLIIVMIFAMVVGRVPPSTSLAVMAASFGITTIFLALTLPVERAAASAVENMLERSAVVPRADEARKLARLVKGLAWQRIVPGALAWIGRK